MRYKRFLIEPSKNYAARIFRCPEQWDEFDFTLHWHRDYEFIYVQKGPVRLQKLDCEIVLNDGEVYFLNSEELHSYVGVTEDLNFMVVNISPDVLQPYFQNPSDVPTFEIAPGQAYDKIVCWMQYMREAKFPEDRLEVLKIKAALNTVSYYLLSNCSKPDISYVKGSDSDDFDCSRSAILYMEMNYQRNITLTEIANYVGMTPSHFSKYFRDKNETTFTNYLRRLRLNHAISDLSSNEISVKTAAERNGFPNVNSMIYACKEFYGRTPLEMKQFAKI